jgi:tetratricopeptide (TPR) repeat protein
MLVEWSREAGLDAVEPAARALLTIEPSDAWARRELALALVRGRRHDEALDEALQAAGIEPRSSYSHFVLAVVYRQRGQVAEARSAFRKAIECGVDNGDAIGALIDLARSDEERRADLALVERELVRQVVMGDGLLAYVDIARPILEPEALLAVLRDAHRERPDLWHAWAGLVAQLGHTLRLDEALDVALRATERFAHLPRAWLDLALAHRWRNDLEKEIAAAERAFEMSPIWTPATLALTNALERCGRLDAASATYRRALDHSPHDPQLHVHYAALLWRRRSGEDALAAVERALRLAPGDNWAWALFQEWAEQSGQPQRPAEFGRALARERAGEALVWVKLTRMLTAPGCEEERFRSIDQAIELNPRSTEAWDVKAEYSALAERFDAAIRACDEGAALCNDETHMLSGRRAWIEARRGQRGEAIRLMRAVLADNAGYVWGWHQLASWLLEERAVPEATAALEQLRRLRPHDSWVHRQLGFLHLERQDREGARKSFAAVLEATPTDVAAAHSLLRIQLDASDLDGAAATLAIMQTHQPGATTLAAEIALRLRQRSVKTALMLLQALSMSPDPDPWPLDAAANAFLSAERAPDALKALKRSAKQATCNPQTGVAIVRLLIRTARFFAATRAFMQFPAGEMQTRAAAPLVQGLAENRCKLLLRLLLWRRRAVLNEDDAAWGQVGYALSNFKRMSQVVSWLDDWRQRPAIEPWMLFNYCLALRHLGRDHEAAVVAAHAIEVWAHRDGAQELHLFLAVERAFAGAAAEARAHLSRITVRKDVAYDQQMAALVEVVAALHETPRAERPRSFRAAKARLLAHFGPLQTVYATRDVRRTLKRTGELFSQEGAGMGAWLWFMWKLRWQWSLLALTPIAIVVGISAPASLGLLLVAAGWGLSARR